MIRPTRILLAIVAVVIAGRSRPAAASQTTELGARMAEAGGLVRTESLVVARLIRRVNWPDAAYVIFDTERVLRGRPQGRLVFTHPESETDSSIKWHSITDEEIAQLVEGRRFLVWLGRGEPATLMRWKPLPPEGPSQEAALAAELKPYEELDRNLALEPWAAATHRDIYVRGCVNAYYWSSATPAAVEARLAEFVTTGGLTEQKYEFLHTLLNRVQWRGPPLSGELLVSLYRAAGEGAAPERGRGRGRGRVIRGQVLELVASRPGVWYDDIIIDALRSPDQYLRVEALSVLAKRRVPAADRVLDASWLRRKGERDAAAPAIVRQWPDEAVREILALLAKSPTLVNDSPSLLRAIADHVRPEHADAIRRLDDPDSRPRHALVTQMLVAARDPEGRAELARLSGTSAMERLPWHGDPWVLREADAFRPLARRVVGEGLVDGSNFISAVSILKHLGDPDLHALLVKATASDWFHRWALQFLQEVAQPGDRTLFLPFTAPGHRHAECRVYALAGLARLGDADAAAGIVEAAWLAPTAEGRYYAVKFALPTLDPDVLSKSWESRNRKRGLDPDTAQYVTARLEQWAAARRANHDPAAVD
jgi:hypothetical protein